MAVLFPPRLYARDASGNGYSGALLYVYTINTTTPASVYTTSALSTPHASPVVADSNGLFAAIYAADGTTFDVVLKTSGGVTIWTSDDMPAVGEAPASLLRDFGSGGRFEVSGSGGAITMKAMDASGDDTGGDLTIQGGGSTALDTLYLNATDLSVRPSALHDTGGTDLTIGGEIKQEGGKRSPHLIWAEGTFTTASTLDLAIPSGYDTMEVEIRDLVLSSSQDVRIRFSYDGGSTYASTSGDYLWYNNRFAAGGLISSAGDGGSGIYIVVQAISASVTTYKSRIRARITTTSTASVGTEIEGIWTKAAESGVFVGSGKSTLGRPSHVRFYPAAGTFTGLYRTLVERGLGGTDA